MTEPDQAPEQDLTVQEEARVRSLLAAARHDEPIPGDVAARLDRVLARLGDEPESSSSLAAGRRRRGGQLLVAAACLVVGGVVVGQVVSGPDSDPRTASDTDSDVHIRDSTEASASGAAPSTTAADSDSASSFLSTVDADAAPVPTSATPVEVRPEYVAQDAAAMSPAPRDLAARAASAQAASAQATWFVCEPAPWGDGDLVAVRYDGEPAVLAYRPPAGDTRVVEVLRCGTAEVLRSVTLPLP